MPDPVPPGVHRPDPTEEDVRRAARAFIAAFEHHLRTVETRTGEADPRVASAFGELRGAFLDYEDTLYDVYDEVVPFEIVEDDDYDEDDEDDDDDDDVEIVDLSAR